MGMFFGGAPKVPAIPKPPAPPTINQAQTDVDNQDVIRRRQGVAADILMGSSGAPKGAPTTGTSVLLGA